ncbi:MAG: GNAT family N-acetyltransferase [Kiritimatiellia bacterium]|jgi:deoxyribonuclease-4
MYRIGLKLWSTNTDHYLSEALRLHGEGVFSYIELYVVPDSLPLLPQWAGLDIPFVIHCPHFMHGFNLAKREQKASNRAIYEQVRQYADRLKAPYIIFHGGIDGSIEETARQLAAFRESRALIENKPYRALPNRMGGEFCRGVTVEEVSTVMERAGCGFCLDFGHAVCAANSFGRNHRAFIRELLTLSPAMFHLTDLEDAASEFDSHAHLGEGRFDVRIALSLLPENALVTLETNKGFKEHLDDFVQDAQWMRRNQIVVRPVRAADIDLLFELANDKLVRSNSFHTDPIRYEEHQRWFHAKTEDPDTMLLIVENAQGHFVGQIRFDQRQDSAEVSIVFSAEFRGKGLSSLALRLALDYFRSRSPSPVVARVKAGNRPSLSLFAGSGFVRTSEDNGVIVFCYEE